MNEATPIDFIPAICEELNLPARGVGAVIELLVEGNSVPFIARYRKEATGGLDEVEIRDIEEKHNYMTELEARRKTIIESITEQEKMTPELAKKINEARTKSVLEDLYLPYKPKRRTRATIAREKGLEPLGLMILEQPDSGDPEAEAAKFIDADKEVATVEDALSGARDIAAEIVAENADVRAFTRRTFQSIGEIATKAKVEDGAAPTKYEQYYDFSEKLSTIPSHRFLAIKRGEKEGVLRTSIEVDVEAVIPRILRIIDHSPQSPFAEQLEAAVGDGYKRLLAPAIETEVLVDLKLSSDREAVEIFAGNLRNLLLTSPMGGRPVIGIDPGIRTGCKCAAVDATGKYLDSVTIFPNRSGETLDREQKSLAGFIEKFKPSAVAIGNGTYGRETEAFVRKTLTDAGRAEETIVVSVSESGASVYSASDIAREEFPDLDLTIRGAISIARRLQDPLAELVKVDPKAIGVGQYQHDVFQPLLHQKLGEVTESCVNYVGVELNTASVPLLAHVAGIGPGLAKKIVTHREKVGAFNQRAELQEVSGLGPVAFKQAAGFLRVAESPNPLDASAVHPERYQLVERIAADMNVSLVELVNNDKLVDKIEIEKYIDDTVGEPTLRDIVAELKKPGRDPRADFEPPKFKENISEIEHLKKGMSLEGVVTNVTAFGAFVDVGVHQDGLVHISELADRFVKDPQEVVTVGQKINVHVLDVDVERKRISLSAKSNRGEADASSNQRAPEAGERKAREKNRDHGAKKPTAAPQAKPAPAGASIHDLKSKFKKY